MDPDERAERLLEAVLELVPAQRNGFLASACRDEPELRRDLASLLAHAEGDPGFLRSPLLRVAVPDLAELFGADTGPADKEEWTYVNVRRLFLTAGRWIERHLTGPVFAPHDPRLWARLARELTVYFTDLFERGALKGSTPQEAFFVKCDAETNPPEVRDAGHVVTEIGLAPVVPGEFVVIRIVHGSSGIEVK